MTDVDMLIALDLCPVMKGNVFDLGPETCDICPYNCGPGMECVRALNRDVSKRLRELLEKEKEK